MASYCSVKDVVTPYPSFVINDSGDIQQTDIQGWIDQRKSRIRSALLTRGFDPDAVELNEDQANFLRSLNTDGAVADLGDALQNRVSLQGTEAAVPGSRRKIFETVIKELMDGKHDVLFQNGAARIVDVTPLFKGVGGAETSPSDTPPVLGTNILTYKNQTF